MAQRKAFPLRLDPAVYDALQRWADAELRSINGQIEFLLRRALKDAGRLPVEISDRCGGQMMRRRIKPTDTLPKELARSAPRQVMLTAGGVGVAIAIAALFTGAIVARLLSFLAAWLGNRAGGRDGSADTRCPAA